MLVAAFLSCSAVVVHGGAVKKVESFDKYRNAQLKKLDKLPQIVSIS